MKKKVNFHSFYHLNLQFGQSNNRKKKENCRNFHQKSHLYLRLENLNPIKKFNKIIRSIYKKKVNIWEKNPIIASGNSILIFLDYFLKTKTFIFTYLRRISKPKFFVEKKVEKRISCEETNFFSTKLSGLFSKFSFF